MDGLRFAMEPAGRVYVIPLFFSPGETAERRVETNLDGQFIFSPPRPGFLPTIRANPNPLPLDMYGTKDVTGGQSGETQYNYPPATLGRDFGQIMPLVFPDKYLHQTLELR